MTIVNNYYTKVLGRVLLRSKVIYINRPELTLNNPQRLIISKTNPNHTRLSTLEKFDLSDEKKKEKNSS